MKNMKKHKLFILFVVSSLLIIGGGVLYFLLNNINSQNQITANTEQLKEESYIDFYNLYYALEQILKVQVLNLSGHKLHQEHF
ncbi:CHASE3 domain-containing protein [Cytobacillus kochii]